MSSIALIFDLDNKTWVANGSDLSHAFVDVTVGFRSSTMPIVFRDLSFGVTLTNIDENLSETHNFPKHGISYIGTDQPYVELIRFEWAKNTKYTISAWCSENNVLSENTWNLTTPDFMLEPYPDYEVS